MSPCQLTPDIDEMSSIALPFDDFDDISKIMQLQLKQDVLQQEAPPLPVR